MLEKKWIQKRRRLIIKIKNLKSNKSKVIKRLDFEEGILSDKDKIAPAYISIENPKYIEIDNLYYGGLIVTNYYREQTDIILKSLIETNINMMKNI